MTAIKKVIDNLSKSTKAYESKPPKDKPKADDDTSFKEEQQKLEQELLKLKEDKERKNALETIVVNSRVAARDSTFQEFEEQHFHKAFEGVKAEYKQHDVINPNSEEKNNDAYMTSKNFEESHSNAYHSDNHPHKHYKSNSNKGY